MIIAFAGYKQSGKDTCAKYLIDKYGFSQYSFALPLKEGVKAFFGWSNEQVNDPILKETVDPYYGVSPRYILQIFGTEVMRQFIPSLSPEFKEKMGGDFWVNRFKQFISVNSNKNIVLSDLRFQNELDAVHSLGGQVIKIHREASVPKDLTKVHSSENPDSLMGIDYLLDNNGDIQNLQDGLDAIWQDMKVKN